MILPRGRAVPHQLCRATQALFPIRQDYGCSSRRALVAVLAFVVVPFFASEYLLRAILIPFLILAIAAVGLNLLVGYCGQISLGSAAFMAVGAYASYDIALHFPWLNLVVVFVAGRVVRRRPAFCSACRRCASRAIYLAVATLAAQFFFDWMFIRIPWFTGYAPSGSVSAPPLRLFGLHVRQPGGRYLFCLALLCVIALAAKNIVRGRIGRMWMAIRDMDIAAEIIGISPLRAKLSAFAISSFVVGVVGGAVGLCPSRLVGAARLLDRPLVRAALHDRDRRARLDPRRLSRRRLHHDAADLAEPAAAVRSASRCRPR